MEVMLQCPSWLECPIGHRGRFVSFARPPMLLGWNWVNLARPREHLLPSPREGWDCGREHARGNR
jgi:hypothetical protein